MTRRGLLSRLAGCAVVGASGLVTARDQVLRSRGLDALSRWNDEVQAVSFSPARLRIPTKLGFKNAKFVTAIRVTDSFPGGYWEDQGYGWFAGLWKRQRERASGASPQGARKSVRQACVGLKVSADWLPTVIQSPLSASSRRPSGRCSKL